MLVLKLEPEEEVTLFLDDLIPGMEPIVVKAVSYHRDEEGVLSLRVGITADKRIKILRNKVIERLAWEKVAKPAITQRVPDARIGIDTMGFSN